MCDWKIYRAKYLAQLKQHHYRRQQRKNNGEAFFQGGWTTARTRMEFFLVAAKVDRLRGIE